MVVRQGRQDCRGSTPRRSAFVAVCVLFLCATTWSLKCTASPRLRAGSYARTAGDMRSGWTGTQRHAFFSSRLWQQVRLVLRGGGENTENRGQDLEDEEPSVGILPSSGGSRTAPDQAGAREEDEQDFSVGALSDAPTAEEGRVAQNAGKQHGAQGRAGVIAEEGEEDEADVIECKFERIGDTNGVFYYLGMQRCADATEDVVAQALKLQPTPSMAGEAEASAREGTRRFRNPALTGRIQVKTGPRRVMCSSKFKGRIACPEQVHRVYVYACVCSVCNVCLCVHERVSVCSMCVCV